MIFALLTALCWSISGFASSRNSRRYGAATANILRLSIASLILFCICSFRSVDLQMEGALWFMLAGISHLCIGDMGLFGAFRRIGPRLGVLMVGTLAPPIALLSEWILLGTEPEAVQLFCAAGVILLVAIAIAPRERAHLQPKELIIGLLLGVVGAVGQGVSASLQRFGYSLTENLHSDPWQVTFLRVGTGTVAVFIWLVCLQIFGKEPLKRPPQLIPHERIKGHPALWIGISSVMGPIIGMLFVITALRTTPSGLVQAGISTMPVFMIPVAWVLDGNTPSIRSVLAGIAAVALTATLIFI